MRGLDLEETTLLLGGGGLFRRGMLVAGRLLNARTLRLEPALNSPRALVDEVIARLEDTLEELTA